MSRYIVTPLTGIRNTPYYIVTDTATGKGVEGYGCETWAQHRADELNAKPDTHLASWTSLLDRTNHAKVRRTPEDMEKAKWGRNRHGKE